jgi:hypothetical protein
MQLAVVLMAWVVLFKCPLERRVWLTQMVEAVVVEMFNLGPVQVTTTTLAQQSAVLFMEHMAALLAQLEFKRVVMLVLLAALATAMRKAMTRRLMDLIYECIFILFIINKI